MTAALRVLHAHSGNLFGGIERVLITLAEVSHQHSFALCFGGRLEDELRAVGADTRMVGAVKFSRPLSLLGARRRFGGVLAEVNPDIVLCHSTWAYNVFAPVVRTAGKPLAFWLHAPPTGHHWLERLARRRPPDVVIANSEWTRESASCLFAGVATEMVYPPVGGTVRDGEGRWETARDGEGRRKTVGDGEGDGHLAPGFQPGDQQTGGRVTPSPVEQPRRGYQPPACTIVMVARMEEEKGQGVLIEVLGKLGTDLGWQCWFVGGAVGAEQEAYLARLENRAEELGIAERVRFLGERDDVPALLGAADLFCHPNIRPEGFGVAFIEALYAGLPVIASANGGALEIVDETCGVLTRPGDVGEVKEALARLVGDPDARAALGRNGPARARELCEAARQSMKLVRVLERAVGLR